MTLLFQADLQKVVPRGLGPVDWGVALAIFLVGLLLSRLVERLLVRAFSRNASEPVSAKMVSRLAGYVVVLAGFIYALSSLHVQLGPLLGALGIGGLAIAIAMQSTLENFISGIFLETRRPFRRGDQIFTNDYEGVVEDINLRSTVVRTFDGRRVIIPNGAVLNAPVVNYTVLGGRRTTLRIGVEYSADLEQVKEIMLNAIGDIDDVLGTPPPSVFVEEFADSSIVFAIHFWHAPEKRSVWQTRDQVAIAIKKALDSASINIPFPQVRLGPVTVENPTPRKPVGEWEA